MLFWLASYFLVYSVFMTQLGTHLILRPGAPPINHQLKTADDVNKKVCRKGRPWEKHKPNHSSIKVEGYCFLDARLKYGLFAVVIFLCRLECCLKARISGIDVIIRNMECASSQTLLSWLALTSKTLVQWGPPSMDTSVLIFMPGWKLSTSTTALI